MWRLFKLGYRHEPRLLTTAFVLSLLSALPDAMVALWLALLGKGVVHDDSRLVMVAAVGLAASATLTWRCG
jgi:ATP-binding cassette subfamily B protein